MSTNNLSGAFDPASFRLPIEGSTLKKTTAFKGFAGWKTMKYLLRHPINGTRNLLALKGAKSMITPKRAAVTAAVATTAVAVPIAVRAMKDSDEA